VIDWLVQSARSYIYTTAAPPAIAHAVLASLRLIAGDEGEERHARLAQSIGMLRDGLTALVQEHRRLGWRLADSATAIQPLIVGDNAVALALAAALVAQGLWVPAIRPPTVPVGTARLRITLSAAHTPQDVQTLVEGLERTAGALR
jgi:8-amino-7-oxononanoate synthase